MTQVLDLILVWASIYFTDFKDTEFEDIYFTDFKDTVFN